MLSVKANKFVRQIEAKLPGCGDDLDKAVEAMRDDLFEMTGFEIPRDDPDLLAARHDLEKRLSGVEVIHRVSIVAKHTPWYRGPRPGRSRWSELMDRLLGPKSWDEDTVAAIDRQSTEIVSLLGDPKLDKFERRGLVLGYVQSGKTANMTAVIAKAVDEGYTTVIVLAGLTDKLRQQTQLRFMEDFGIDQRPGRWHLGTSPDIDGDFKGDPSRMFSQFKDAAQLFVVKKNRSPLTKLRELADTTGYRYRKDLRVLIIDDECDQATVNSASKELDMTAINQKIRELLRIFPAATYVGYTATPFANVFIDPYASHAVGEDTLDDLYPRDFISALEMPKGYFGTQVLFGRPALDAEEEEDGIDVIREVKPEEVVQLQPPSRDERFDFTPKMPESLEDAVLYFLAAAADRRIRGQGNKHMTMLVHTSAWTEMHRKIADMIERWIAQIEPELRAGEGPAVDRMAAIWQAESARAPGWRGAGFAPIRHHLPEVLDALEVPIENGASDDRIAYQPAPGKPFVPRTYIAVGGSILARGLTLEGLTVSYFLRTARQYDTLMQMGRWFGYRHGYEDLPRIWMPEDLRLSFRAMAGVETEIRAEIARYKEEDCTPAEIAVRVRSIPGMAITARNKMRATSRCDVSYWGRRHQTFRFNRFDEAEQASNWAAGERLIASAIEAGRRVSGENFVWTGVPDAPVRRFLESYAPHSSHRDLGTDLLVGFLEQARDQLNEWNIAVIAPDSGVLSRQTFGQLGQVRMSNRARLDDGSAGVADIMSLMSRKDAWIDCADLVDGDVPSSWQDAQVARERVLGLVPLLLLYPIDRISPPSRSNGLRVNMDACRDLLGYGIIFPGAGRSSGDYVSVTLNPTAAEDVEEEEALEAEREQAEAAGV